INKQGLVSGIRTRGPDKLLEKEAARIVSLLPKMIPGKQRGKAVRVPYALPINFQLID
ncbi:MAG: energy transducer TonB, partial [Bacteroidia bacterium]|nr:energy transducer TonB [Bacteroidia bacterium]